MEEAVFLIKGDLRAMDRSGASLNVRNHDGDTALVAAAREGYLPTVRLLLDEGARVNDKDGWRAWKLASDSRHDAIANLLVEKVALMQ
ncbi:uncharacterized protein PG986_004067 [Apiospora aurea]|uniref:Ankyrin repeat protein n=1 Tax=Apiospora aurea TaxID=335848 RepID=A0ABR1QLS2_9PEZI